MSKIDAKTELILFGGRAAMLYLGWKASKKWFLAGAVAGVVFSEKMEKETKVSDHLRLDALTMRKNPMWLSGLIGITFFIAHCDHHALDPIPVKPIVFGYVVGSYGTYWLWQDGRKSS